MRRYVDFLLVFAGTIVCLLISLYWFYRATLPDPVESQSVPLVRKARSDLDWIDKFDTKGKP